MISFGSNTKVYLAAGATDMRKAMNGLMVLVQDALEADPFSCSRHWKRGFPTAQAWLWA
ncbi:MAG: IS66 family insertion sequence element accessory protein TnpB [Sedimenticola sp.]